MFDFETNVREILDCNLPNIKDEVKDVIARNIINITPRALEPFCFDDIQNMRVMGYTVADLIIVAERLNAGGIDIMQLKNYTDGFKDGYERANEDFNKAMRECVKSIIGED